MADPAGDSVASARCQPLTTRPGPEAVPSPSALASYARPRTALRMSFMGVQSVTPSLLLEMLERCARGEEADSAPPAGWHIGEVVELLEQS